MSSALHYTVVRIGHGMFTMHVRYIAERRQGGGTRVRGHGMGPNEYYLLEALVFFYRAVTWDTPMARWAGSGKIGYRSGERVLQMIPTLVLAIHLSPLQVKKADGGIPLRKERKQYPLLRKPPRTVEGIELVIRGDNKTVVDWINGEAKQKVSYRAIEIIQIQLVEWWKKGVDLC